MRLIGLHELAPQVRLVQHIRGDDRYRLPPRIIYDYEAIFVLDGACEYRIEEETYLLEQGCLLFMPPRVRHSCSVPAGRIFHYYAVHFDLVPLGDSFDFSVDDIYLNRDYATEPFIPDEPALADRPAPRLAGIDLPYVIQCTDPESYARVFRSMHETHEHPRYGSELKLRACKLELFALLLGEVATPSGVSRRHPQAERIQSAVDWIKARYREPIQLADMAASVHLSPGHFRTLFRDATGRSPVEFLMRYRLEQAKQLLLHTPLTVGEIAADVGYPDLHYFSRLFKQAEGLSPVQFRETLGKHR